MQGSPARVQARSGSSYNLIPARLRRVISFIDKRGSAGLQIQDDGHLIDKSEDERQVVPYCCALPCGFGKLPGLICVHMMSFEPSIASGSAIPGHGANSSICGAEASGD